ncbi:MAG: hypothetical protein IPL40_11550 [Proteobacteria bacterium]|nr:hypothetical protein [Pseudomonadota bacterium]
MGNVGADIESICGKCGDVWHVVVAKVGVRVAKVQCKQCGGLHGYRPPGGLAKAAPARERRSSRATGRRPSGRVSAEAPLPTVDRSKPLRTYRLQETFAVGDRLLHPTFGEGVVELQISPQKIQVAFVGKRRVMAQALPPLEDA